MTREEIDKLWFKAMHESVKDGEDCTRYHFAALVAEHEREACIKALEENEQFYCRDTIRARGKTK